MHLALAPARRHPRPGSVLRMGFTLLNRIAIMLGWEVDPDPNPEGPIDLTFAEFEQQGRHARERISRGIAEDSVGGLAAGASTMTRPWPTDSPIA